MTARLALLGLFGVAVTLGQAAPARSQADASRVLTIQPTVLGVLSRVESIGETSVESPSDVRVQLAGDILFEFNKADLTPQAQGILAAVATDIDAKAKGPVTIDGYSDSIGDATYNQMLSQQRAAAVQQALQSLVHRSGVTFTANGHGADDPIAPNANPDGSDNPAGRAQNRRVTVSFPK